MATKRHNPNGCRCVTQPQLWAAFVTVLLLMGAVGAFVFDVHAQQPHDGAVRSIELDRFEKAIGARFDSLDRQHTALLEELRKR